TGSFRAACLRFGPARGINWPTSTGISLYFLILYFTDLLHPLVMGYGGESCLRGRRSPRQRNLSWPSTRLCGVSLFMEGRSNLLIDCRAMIANIFYLDLLIHHSPLRMECPLQIGSRIPFLTFHIVDSLSFYSGRDNKVEFYSFE